MSQDHAAASEMDGQGDTGEHRTSPVWWGNGHAWLLTALTISSFGDRISYIIIPFCLLMVDVPVASVAIVLGARAIGYAMVVLYGGVIADRVSRRRVMILSDLVRFGTQSTTAVLVFAEHQGVVMFVSLQFVFGAAEALFKPAAAGLIPELVPEEFLERANGLLGSAVNMGMIIGPVLGGLLVGTGLAGTGLIVDSATFLISAVLLTRLPPSKQSCRPRQSILLELRAGWEHLLARRILLLVIVASSLFELLALAAVFSLGPVLANQALGGAHVWGLLVTAFGIGAVSGGLVTVKLSPRRPGVWCAVLLAILSAQPLFLSSGLPIELIAVLQLLTGMSLTAFGAISGATTQRLVPRHALSRVAAFDSLATTGLLPLGYLLVGGLAGLAGIIPAMRIVSVLSIAICLAILASPSVRESHVGRDRGHGR
ncbi:MFS transporter [Streptomyces sp. Lzd4kr]|nr:MFS transporter [Streptomyces sp. Lzd4kr]